MSLVIIAHDIRSTHNVGSLLRTAEGLGVDCVYFTGITPYPVLNDQSDSRLPHMALKLTKQIHKTALGAEVIQKWKYSDDVTILLSTLKHEGYELVALEQAPNSEKLSDFKPKAKTALLLGREVEGVEATLLAQCNRVVEIPMSGNKESYNVVQATAIAAYTLLYER